MASYTDREPADATPLDTSGTTVARLARLVDAALQEHDMSLPHFRLFTYLRDGVHAPTALSGRLTITRAGVSSLLDGLEARGLVRREPDADDGRRRVTRLTPAGMAMLEVLERAVDQRLTALAGFLDEHEREEARRGLKLWSVALERAWHAEPGGVGTIEAVAASADEATRTGRRG